MKVFQFNKHTPATSRHNKIHEFQHAASGAYVFAVTVQTAAVGITLTAATRVYPMEPLSDPAAEVQGSASTGWAARTSSSRGTRSRID